MGVVCIVSNGAVLGIEGGCLKITYPQDVVERIPKETIQGISIFGKSHMTSSCVQFCLENQISVSYFTQSGRYYGCLQSTCKTNIKRLKQQIRMSEDEEFSLAISRKIIHAKINNQLVVARRYLRGTEYSSDHMLYNLRNSRRKVENAETKQKLLGYEGIASRNYFDAISAVIEPEFYFQKRTKRPPRDPFNCMISFGYSLLTKEIYGELENRGLSAYAGFLHEDREKHPALASDLIEEWRATIVDSVVMSLIQGHEVKADMFFYQSNHVCMMSREVMKIMFVKMEKKMQTESQYLSYIQKPITFRKALWHQAERLAKAIECENPEIYMPVMIR